MMKNLKEYLITSLIFPILVSTNPSTGPRWLDGKPRYPHLIGQCQSRINVEEENRKGVQSKREVGRFTTIYTIKDFNLDTNLEGASELGLQYLSGLLDKPMDQIINWLF